MTHLSTDRPNSGELLNEALSSIRETMDRSRYRAGTDFLGQMQQLVPVGNACIAIFAFSVVVDNSRAG